MFDFEKLVVYQKALQFNSIIQRDLINGIKPEKTVRYQLSRASVSIMLNITEGSGRFSSRDKRNFYVIARGSLFECIAICDYLNQQRLISSELYQNVYASSEEISKMLFSMIRQLEEKD